MRHDLHITTPPPRYGRKKGRSRLWLQRIVAAVILVAVGVAGAYAAGGDVAWQFGDAMIGKQESKSMGIDSGGNVIMTGYQSASGGIGDDFYTVKIKADGSGIAWRAVFDKAGNSDQATAVVVDGDDNVIVTGFAWNGVNNDIHTIKYNGATGAVLWQNSYNGAANGNDVGTSIAVDGLNNVYVGGFSQDSAGNNTFIVLKYAAAGPKPDGTPTWAAIADGAVLGINRVNSIAAGSTGVAVTGQTWNGAAFEVLTVKFDGNGTTLWETRHSTGPTKSCIGKYVKFDGAGNVVVTGAASNGIDLDIVTIKYDGTTGNMAWEATYNGAYDDEPNALAIGPNGNVYITGYTWTLTAQNDFYTAKYNGTTGELMWEKTFNSTNGNDDITAATGIVVDPAGDVFVTGYTITGKNYDFQTIKYRKDNGNQLWNKSYNGPANKNDRPIGIGISPTGNVIVGGWSDTAANDLDFFVITYDAGLIDRPTGLTAQATSNTQVQLAWTDNSGNETGFSVERCQNPGCSSFAEIGTTGANVTAFTDNDVTPENYYTYRVRALSATAGYSHYSDPATVLTVVVQFIPPIWSYTRNGAAGKDDFANAIAIGPDNNPVIAGQSNDYPPGYSSGITSFDYLLVKLNHADMSIIWSDRYNDPTDASDIATCVAVDSDNSVVVSGYATLYNGTSRDVNSLYTIRYPAGGPPALRSDQYNGPVAGGATDDRAVAVAIASAADTSNNVIVVGYGKNAAGNDDIYVLKYNPDGTRAWAATPFDGNGGDDFPTAVVLALDGSIYVTGYSEKSPDSTTYNFFTARYNGTTGARIWTDTFSVVPSGTNRGNNITFDASGDVYVTGSAMTAGGTADIYTIKYRGGAGSAERLWERAADGLAHGSDEGIGVRIDPVDGAVVVAGTTVSGAGDHDVTVTRYTASGTPLWTKTYQRPASDDYVTALGVDREGNIYAAGNTGDGTTTDSLTVKFDYLGNIRSATRYGGSAGSFDETSALAVNSLDEVFVAGYSTNASGNADYLVYKIAPDLTVPLTPFAVTGIPSYTSATVSWSDRSTVIDGFRVERKGGSCTSAGTWEQIRVLPGTTTSITDPGLSTSSTYCYRVQSFLNSGAASRWAEKEITTPAPTAPTSATATAINTTRATVSWSDTTSGESAFRIERCIGATCSDFTAAGVAPANTTTFTDTSLCPGITYRYRVFAVGQGWESPASNIPPPVTTSTPAVPAVSATRVSEAEINLTWTDTNSDEGGFMVERCSGAGCDGFVTIATLPGNAASFRDSGLVADTLYRYRLTVFKNDSCTWERTSNATGATTTLVAPAGLSASASSTTSFNLSWSDNTASETGFSIEKCTGSGCNSFGEIATVGTNVTTFTDTSACSAENATYRVRATRAAVTLSNGNNSCWTKRVPVAVSGFQANYQTRVTIPHDSDMLTNFDDIRFVDTNAGVELPYWIESKTDGTSATVWFKTGMNNSVYLYFGNAAATSSSSGTAVFDFFDDFAGATIDSTKWGTTGAFTVSNGTLRVNTGAVYSTATVASTPQGRTFEMKAQWLTGATTASGLAIANASSTQTNNAGANALAYFMSDTGATANLLPYGATGTAASYNIASGTLSSTYSTNNALYNPYVSTGQNTRVPASGLWTPPQGGNITRMHVRAATESCCDHYRVYNAAGTLIGDYVGNVDQWIDISPTTGIYTVFTSDYSVYGGFGGDIPEVAVAGLAATGQLNTDRIVGFQFDTSTSIRFVVQNTDYSDIYRNTYTGTWNIPPYLWLGHLTGAAAGTTDGDDMTADWVRVRKYAAAEPVATIGGKEASECFTFGSPWTGSYTNSASATTPSAGAPVLTATRASEVQINLSWSDSASDENGYRIERCSGTGCDAFTQVAVRPANTTGYNDPNLIPGTSYSYRVKAYKSATCSWETVSNMATETTTISGPAGLSATAADTTRVTLSWTNTTASETGFTIERCEGVGCSEFSSIGTATARSTSYSDSTVCSGYTYSYRVTATNNLVPWTSIPSETAATVTPSLTNRLADGGFEKSPTAWATAVGTITNTSFDTTTAKDGGKSLKLAAAGAQLGRAQSVTVAAGRSYVLSGWINSAISSGKVQCDVFGTGIDSAGIAVTAASPDNNAGWVSLNETLTIPAGTTNVSVRCFADAGTYGSAWFDSISLAPADFVLAATRTSEILVTLTWPDSAEDETGYRIERCSGETCDQFTLITSVGANVTTYADGGRSPNTTYRYRVRGYKNGTCAWEGSDSSIASVLTSPAAPTNINATTPNSTQVTLTWTDTTASETGFEVERCTGDNCDTFTRINTTGSNASSYPDTTVSSSTTYTYRVRAVSSTVPWASGYSGTKVVTTPTPAAPAVSTQVISETQINLSWTDPLSDETGYRIYRCAGSGCTPTLVTSVGANVTTYSDTGRTAGVTYTYQIEGYKGGTNGWTVMGAPVSAVTTPLAPATLTVQVVNTTQVKLTWVNRTSSESGITIERCQGSGCSSFAAVATVGAGITSYNDTTLCNAQPFSYRVQAINATAPWASDYSNTVSITVPAPTPPSALAVTRDSEAQLRITWNDTTSDESGFKIERCTNADCTAFSQIGTAFVNVRSYNDTTVDPNVTYRYRIRAYKTVSDGCGWDSGYSDIVQGVSSVMAPSGLTATAANSTKINLSWTNNTATETGYRVERCQGINCSSFAEVTTLTGKATSWSDTTVASATSYSYRIRATNSTRGWDSDFSNTATAATPAQGAPSNLTATTTTTRVTLGWADNTADETSFSVERCTGNPCSDYAVIKDVAANVTSYADDTVCMGTAYTYRVRAISTAIPYQTPYSTPLPATTGTPAAPAATAVRASESQINLSWSDPTSDETGYRIERCSGTGCSDFVFITSVPANTTTYADAGLVPGYTYTYRVKGYKSAACPWETASIPVSAATSIATPTALSATAVNTTQVNLSWTDTNTSKTGVRIERCTGNGCTTFTEIGSSTGNASTWSDTTAASGTTYTYRVRAARDIPYAWTSDYSGTATATTPPVSAPAALVAHEVSRSGISLTWTDTSTDESGYRIERCAGTACTDFTEIQTIGTTAAYSDTTGLSPSSTYCYRVRAFKSGASTWNSAYTNTACATTVMDGPDTLTATPLNSMAVKLTWVDNSSGEGGFNLEQQVWNNEWVTVASLGADQTSYVDAVGLEPLKSYKYRIRAFRGATSSTYSNVASAATPGYTTGDTPCPAPPNNAPVISSTPAPSATENTLYTYAVVATATGGGPLTYSLPSKPSGMVVSGSGVITWTPTYSQSGPYNVTVRVTDGSGRSTDQNFSVTVTNQNRKPVIGTITATTAIENHHFAYGVPATDPDGDALAITLTTAPSGMTITSGVISWDPGTGDIGSHDVTVTASDGYLTETRTFTLTVSATHAPVVTSIPVTTGKEGYVYSYQINATDADGDPLTYSLFSAPPGMAISSTGLVTWMPKVTQTGANPVAVRISDGSLVVPHDFTVTVEENHAPSITSTAPTTAAEGSPYSYPVVAADPDGDALTYTLVTAPAGMTVSPAGVISWTPTYDQSSLPPQAVLLRVTDARRLSVDHSFTITVTDVKRPPAITSSAPVICPLGTSYSYQVVASDPEGLPMTYSLTNPPSGMAISTTGLITWSLPPEGSYPVTVQVSDANLTATQTFTLTVAPAPAIPVKVVHGNFNSSCGSTPVTVTWNPVAGPGGHPVNYAVELNNVVQAWQTATSFTFTASNGTSYTWRVKAKDAVTGIESAWSTAETMSDSACCDCSCDNSCYPSSCPFVFVFNGSSFDYVTDLQGPAISDVKKGTRDVKLYQPAYTVLDGLIPDGNGQYRLKLWESLSEASLVDEVKLLAVDYPEGYEIATSGAENTYYYGYNNPLKIYTYKDPVVPLAATDKTGNDILDKLTALDNNPAPVVINSLDNVYTLDFGTIQHPEYAKLLMDGWSLTGYQASTLAMVVQPSIEVIGADGTWVKVKSFGTPAGDLKTMVVDLANIFQSSDHRIRLSLGHRKASAWVIDRIRLDDSAPVPVDVQQLQAATADLQFGGEIVQSMNSLTSRIITSETVLPVKPENYGYGGFTRYGDVADLLTSRDDKYVVMRYADVMDLTFPTPLPQRTGLTRRLVLKADLYYKDFDADHRVVEPLPFHGMSSYPYPSTETYPVDEEHRQYLELYNTRKFTP